MKPIRGRSTQGETRNVQSADVELSAAIMTHRRRSGAEAVRSSLNFDIDVNIVTDPQPDGPPTAWRTARRAWAAVGATATHHLVLQDDVTVAPGFHDWLMAALAARPDAGGSPFTRLSLELSRGCGRVTVSR